MSSQSENQPKRRQRLEVAADAQTVQGEVADNFEAEHVHKVYSEIAQKFSDTRYKPWPKVLEFVLKTPSGGILIDVGCGNGKNMGRLPKESGILELGCDRSVELLSFAAQRQLPVTACDILALPFRRGCADRVICIAVLHHLATPERRLLALRQMFKLLKPGEGRMLIYVWSTEFAKSEIKKGRAGASVLEGAENETNQQQQQQRDEKNGNDLNNDQEEYGPEKPKNEAGETGNKGADVFVSFATKSTPDDEKAPGRFYHLFAPGEAEALCSKIDPENAKVVDSWYDCENWAVEVAHVGKE
jgi:ubiquinone/menaquinone biosynthesis C-methylase UbiE